MDKSFKDMNESILSFMMSSSRQIVELNQKIWTDYVELANSIVAKTTALNPVANATKK